MGRFEIAGITTLAVLGVAAVLIFAVASLGRVRGEEFSPDNFRRRTFTYHQIPLLGVQVRPIRRFDQTGDLEKHLVQKKLITVLSNATPRWDLVSDNRSSTDRADCDARLLTAYFEMRNADQDLVWLVWTKDHPELAKVLWPVVARLARQQLYIFVPEVIELSRRSQTAAQLGRDVDRLLVEKYSQLGRVQQQLGRHAAAVQHFTEALRIDPQHAESLTARAVSLDKLGRSDAANADRSAAKRIAESNAAAEAVPQNGAP